MDDNKWCNAANQLVCFVATTYVSGIRSKICGVGCTSLLNPAVVDSTVLLCSICRRPPDSKDAGSLRCWFQAQDDWPQQSRAFGYLWSFSIWCIVTQHSAQYGKKMAVQPTPFGNPRWVYWVCIYIYYIKIIKIYYY